MLRLGITATKAVLPVHAEPHVHFRRARRELRKEAIATTGAYADYALWMPNTSPGILTGDEALVYDGEIDAVQFGIRSSRRFKTLMTVKLTDETTVEDVRRAAACGVTGFKAYPWEPGHDHVTTNSAGGVSNYLALEEVIAEIFKQGMVLLVHPETVRDFCLDRQRKFIWIAQFLYELAQKHNGRVTFEHATTVEMMRFIVNEVKHDNVLVTVTLQHLLYTLDDMLGGKLQVHLFCKPLLGTPEDRAALRDVMFYLGHPRVCFGSDSAPHLKGEKEAAEGCAGCFTAPIVPQMLLQAALAAYDGTEHKAYAFLERVTSKIPRKFYRLPEPSGVIELNRRSYRVPSQLGGAVPLLAGKTLEWSLDSRV